MLFETAVLFMGLLIPALMRLDQFSIPWGGWIHFFVGYVSVIYLHSVMKGLSESVFYQGQCALHRKQSIYILTGNLTCFRVWQQLRIFLAIYLASNSQHIHRKSLAEMPHGLLLKVASQFSAQASAYMVKCFCQMTG